MATDFENVLNLNGTASAGMSPLMESILNRYVLERNKTARKYTKFGQKVDIPKGRTKTVAFDKLSPLPKATVPLSEGITPKGAAVNITRIKGEPVQLGNYVSYTDQLDFFANDPSPEVLKYADLLTENQLETFEHLDAMELSSGLNVFYTGTAESRASIKDTLCVRDIRRAVTSLKSNKVQPCDGGDYICFIHPNVVFNIWSDAEWRQPHTYSDTKQLYDGEVGRLFGVRFIEDPDAYVFRGTNFGADNRYSELSIIKTDKKTGKVYIAETLTSADISANSSALTTNGVMINGKHYDVTSAYPGSNGSAYIVINADDNSLVEPDMKIYPGDGAVDGRPVYSTVIIGKNAFGTAGDKTVQLINKSLGSAGTGDPLNQRGTVGWKGYRFFKIIEQTKMCRIESL